MDAKYTILDGIYKEKMEYTVNTIGSKVLEKTTENGSFDQNYMHNKSTILVQAYKGEVGMNVFISTDVLTNFVDKISNKYGQLILE